MKLFLDTNIIIDSLVQRHPFAHIADKLILLANLGEFDVWCGASQFTDIDYIVQNSGKSASWSLAAMKEIRKKIHVCSLTDEDVDRALDSGWEDFEDACVYSMADRLKVDWIITRHQDDFAGSFIPVTDAEGFFAALEERGIIYEEITF